MMSKSLRLVITGFLMGLMGLACAMDSKTINVAQCPCGGGGLVNQSQSKVG